MIVDNDIQLYTAFAEQELRSYRNCKVSEEEMYKARFDATEKVCLALIELRLLLVKTSEVSA